MCIFCEIIKGNIPNYTVYEDDKCLAFLDISQATIGHTLVVPKKHFANIFELDEETAKHIFNVVRIVANQISKAFNVKDVNILNNNGKLAYQSVDHFHIHIIPRYEDDAFSIHFSENKLSNEEFVELLDKIKRA